MKNKSASGNETTCYVVAYDISDDRRRTKVHDTLLAYGEWTQYSLFECFLTRKQLILLRSKLAPYLDAAEDSLRFYPLCANCVARVETVGDEPPTERLLFVV